MSLWIQRNLICSLTKPNPFSKRFSSEVQKSEKAAQQAPIGTTSETPKEMSKVGPLRKRLFVMAGLYKSVADCPDAMSFSSLSRNMDKFRVRASLLIMFLCGCGAVSSIMLAKGVVEDFEEGRKSK